MRRPGWAVLASVAAFVAVVPMVVAGQGGAPANLQQATQLVRDGDDAGALAAVRRELQANPASTQAANLLDVLGASAEARPIFQRQIDNAADPAARAAAERAMAMSYAFEGNCVKTIEHEQTVIAYWVTREQAEPQNAFYQQGEMANEAARVCIDAGDFAAAEKWYRAGTAFGLKEPEPKTHPRSLWDYRLAHALGRIAARRGDKAEAQRQVASARRALDGDPTMAAQQERFFPYLVGYVALYTNDFKTADAEFTRALSLQGNQTDPFMTYLSALTYEKLGDAVKAKDAYNKAYRLATSHNPPSAFVRRTVRPLAGSLN